MTISELGWYRGSCGVYVPQGAYHPCPGATGQGQQVTHIHKDSKYRIVFERGAVKGVDGFKVEVQGDDLNDAQLQAFALFDWAKEKAELRGELK